MGKKIQLTESDLKKLVNESVKKIINEMYMNEFGGGKFNTDPEIDKKAKELFDQLGYSDFEFEPDEDAVDGAYTTGYGTASIEDEDGEVWYFTIECGFNWEGDWEVDTSSIDSIEYEAPDGTYGTL